MTADITQEILGLVATTAREILTTDNGALDAMVAGALEDAGGDAEKALRAALGLVLRQKAENELLAAVVADSLPKEKRRTGRPPKPHQGLYIPVERRAKSAKPVGAPKQHSMNKRTTELGLEGVAVLEEAERIGACYNAKMAAKYLIARHGGTPTPGLVANIQKRISDAKRRK